MGWCSATIIFDKMAEFVLSTSEPDEKKRAVLKYLATVLENEDWDCQHDSDYWDHPIVQSIMKEFHPNWETG